MREVVTHASKMTFQACSTRVRDDRHSVLSRNVDDLHDILSRVRIDHDAMRTSYPKVTPKVSKPSVRVRVAWRTRVICIGGKPMSLQLILICCHHVLRE